MRSTLLDLLRTVAIALLLLSHTSGYLGGPLGQFFGIPGFYHVSLGGIAVTIFLILSGIVLQLSYGPQSLEYSSFVRRRILRIYPTYYLCLLFGLIIAYLKLTQKGHSAFSYTSYIPMKDIILLITGFYAFVGEWGGPILSTSWYIGLIVNLYLLFPFLSKAIKNHPNLALGALFIISLASRLFLGHSSFLPNRPLDWFPLCRVFEFGLGMYLATKLPLKTWEVFNHHSLLSKFALFFGALSFPLFLVHFPIQFLITYFRSHGLPGVIAITLYLVICILISWVILKTEEVLQKKKLPTTQPVLSQR